MEQKKIILILLTIAFIAIPIAIYMITGKKKKNTNGNNAQPTESRFKVLKPILWIISIALFVWIFTTYATEWIGDDEVWRGIFWSIVIFALVLITGLMLAKFGFRPTIYAVIVVILIFYFDWSTVVYGGYEKERDIKIATVDTCKWPVFITTAKNQGDIWVTDANGFPIEDAEGNRTPKVGKWRVDTLSHAGKRNLFVYEYENGDEIQILPIKGAPIPESYGFEINDSLHQIAYGTGGGKDLPKSHPTGKRITRFYIDKGIHAGTSTIPLYTEKK